MAYFPMFIELEGKKVLIIGGGRVAFRKIQKLLPYGAEIVVTAPKIMKEIENIPGLILKKEMVQMEELDPSFSMVIAATDDPNVNEKISAVCMEKQIPVNVADNMEKCSFLFPALVRQGAFSAGICTGGASPAAAAYYKERLQEILPENLDEILEGLRGKRQWMKERIPEQSKRAGIFRNGFEACIREKRMLMEAEWMQQTDGALQGRVALVGAGCGKADLITVRGYRLLQRCDAVVYDDLIDPELLEAVPETAEQIYVGKRAGVHCIAQEKINQILIGLARAGKQVVRLKGGDPYLFGRGGEEMQALCEAGIPCEEVPGIPSAIGIPAEAGIPVTYRGISRGLHIVTAHTADTEAKMMKELHGLAQLSGTLVFLMGFHRLPQIAEQLMKEGKSKDTPAAVISGGNSKNPATVRSTLEHITEAVKNAKMTSPAIIVIGDVAAFDLTKEI